MNVVFGLDPGYERSTIVRYDGKEIFWREYINSEMLRMLDSPADPDPLLVNHASTLVIEQIESQGMAVGKETFETVFWSGRFAERWESLDARPWTRVTRRQVKLHICESPKATDANIRRALIDRFGPTEEKAIGTKKAPGPLFGVKSHAWAALAVALTWYDQQQPWYRG